MILRLPATAMDPYAHHVIDGDAAYGDLPFDYFVLVRPPSQRSQLI
jgi:hypothetical protein